MERSLTPRTPSRRARRAAAPSPSIVYLLTLLSALATAACEPMARSGAGERSERAPEAARAAETRDWMPATGEGLHRPADLALPAELEGALRGVVRVKPEIRFRVTLYADRQEAAAARGKADATRKKFLPEGGVLWPVHVDTASVTGLCRNPIAAVQAGLSEVCELAAERCASFPCTRVTEPLGGSGTGFVVGHTPEGRPLLATAYHVAREAAERAGHAGGASRREEDRTAVEALDLAVEAAGEWTRDVRLHAHASEAEWEGGRDWALLSIPRELADRLGVLPLAEEPPSPGDTLWTAGYPYVTIRGTAEALGYPDAADELRVSFGELLSTEALLSGELRLPPAIEGRVVAEDLGETDLVTLVDAASGSSGSPVLDLQGRVVGILRDSTCKEGELDLRISRFCGVTLVVPARLFRDAVARETD